LDLERPLKGFHESWVLTSINWSAVILVRA